MDILDACMKKGLRMTKQRNIIAQILSSAKDHPDINEIYKRALKKDKKISIATVYRTMKLFKEVGIIDEHNFKYGKTRYEVITHDHHDHLIDLETGKVIEFQNEDIEQLQKKIANYLGYELIDHRLELYVVKKGSNE